jgi:hypothetical protein
LVSGTITLNGNAGNLTLTDIEVTENTARKLGGGIGNNTGKVTLEGTTSITNNTSLTDNFDDEYSTNDFVDNRPDPTETSEILEIAPMSFAMAAPVYEISTPSEGELFAKTLTHWEFSATVLSSSPIRDWEINWGDGSDVTEILGGPRSRINVTHYFREAGTYTVTIKTTDFAGMVNTITIGPYTVKEKAVAEEPLVVESFAWVEPELVIEFDTPVFSVQEEPMVSLAAPMQFTESSRFSLAESYLSDLAEIMRQRQMLDLDQSGQKAESVPFTELIWATDDLFDADWTGLSEEPEDADFWGEVFENDLLTLK